MAVAASYTTMSARVKQNLLSVLATGYPDLVVNERVFRPNTLPQFDRYCILVSPSARPWVERRVSIQTLQYTLTLDLHLLVRNFDERESLYGAVDGSLGLFQMVDDVKAALRSTDLSGLLDKTFDEPGGDVSFSGGSWSGLDTAEHTWVHRALIPYSGRLQPFCPPARTA